MTPTPRLTVVIPVHNRAELMEATLRSVASQTLRPLAVVLVDNASTDATLASLQAWKQAVETPDFQVTVVEEPTPGACSARNRGLEEVTTPYVMFFDSDDLMAPTHCSRALAALGSPEAPDIVGWDVEHRTLNGTRAIRRFYDRNTLWNNIMHGGFATQRYALRTSLVRQAGGWNPAIQGWNDIELGNRLLLLRPAPRVQKLTGAPTVTVVAQSASITGTSYSAAPRRWESSLDAIEAAICQSTGNRERLRRYVRLRRAHLAGLYSSEGATAESRRLLAQLLPTEPLLFYRLLYRLAASWTASGRRGILRLLAPFF